MAGDRMKLFNKNLIIGAILVCILVAAALLAWSYSDQGLSNSMKLKLAGNVTGDDVLRAKSVLEGRFKANDHRVAVSPVHDGAGNAFLIVKYGYLPEEELSSMITTRGAFEMRIQAGENGSEHVLYGDDVNNIGVPLSYEHANGSKDWGIVMELTPAGTEKFRRACIDSGATDEPAGHNVIMLLDSRTVYARPLSSALANEVPLLKTTTLVAMVGSDDPGKDIADTLYMCLKGGELPVALEIVE